MSEEQEKNKVENKFKLTKILPFGQSKYVNLNKKIRQALDINDEDEFLLSKVEGDELILKKADLSKIIDQ